MQGKLDKKKETYIPLRRFAHKNLYNEFYLSNLVQRKKLKVKKIGRNYYTTIEWFKEYLALHARDKKRQEYHRFLENLKNNLIKEKKSATDSRQFNNKRRLSKVGFFIWSNNKKLSLSSFAFGFFIALIIILSNSFVVKPIIVWLDSRNIDVNGRQAQVAGVEEKQGCVCTSTEESIK